jgi:hypothetical protein
MDHGKHKRGPVIGQRRNVSENLFVLGSGSAKRKFFPTLAALECPARGDSQPFGAPVLTNPTSAGIAPSGLHHNIMHLPFLMRDFLPQSCVAMRVPMCMHSGFVRSSQIVSGHVPHVGQVLNFIRSMSTHLIRSESDIPLLSSSAIFQTSQRQLERLQ